MKTNCTIAHTSARNRAIGLQGVLWSAEYDLISALQSSHEHRAIDAAAVPIDVTADLGSTCRSRFCDFGAQRICALCNERAFAIDHYHHHHLQQQQRGGCHSCLYFGMEVAA